MKFRIIYSIVFFSLLFIGCNKDVIKPIIKNDIKGSKSEEKEFEYIYTLTEATKQNLLGNYKQSALLLQQCIDNNPDGGAAIFEISKLYLRFQDKENALLYAKKAVKIDSTNFWYLYNLSQMYLFFYENDNAIKIYEKIARYFPENYEMKYDLSLLYYDKNRYDDALKILNELEEKFGLNEEISLKKHQIYVKNNDFENAEEEVIKLIEVNPDEVKYYGVLAELYSNNNMDEKAEEFYKKVFELDGSSGLAKLSYGEYLFNKEEIDSSFYYFKEAFNSDDIKLDYKLDLIFSFLSDEMHLQMLNERIYDLIEILTLKYTNNDQIMAVKADYFNKTEQTDSAIVILKNIVELYPENKRAWEQLFFIMNKEKNYDELSIYCSKAIKYFENEVRYYFYKAIADIQLKNYNEVVNNLNSGLKYIPEDDIDMKIQFYTFLGDNYYRIKEYSKSDSSFEKVLQLDPENIIVLNNYSYYLSVREEKLDKALEMSKIVNKLDPVSATYLDTYAWVLFKKKEYKEAKKIIEKAVNNGGDKSPTIVEHYGDIIFMSGDIDTAVLLWKEAIKLGGEELRISNKIENKTLNENKD